MQINELNLLCGIALKQMSELFNNFGHGVPLLEKLLWKREQNDTLRTSGLYCFRELRPCPFAVSTFLYIGRTQNLHKRFREHRYAWLDNYVLSNRKNQYGYCYVRAEHFKGGFAKLAEIENACWREKEKLGLIHAEKLKRIGCYAD